MENPTKITPLFNRIIVKRRTSQESQIAARSKIILTQSARASLDTASEGTVVAVGSSVDSDITPGICITWGKYAGVEIEREGEKFVMMNDDDILGIIEGGFEDGE